MEFEPVARRWAFRLLDSREVSQDRTRMVLATALFMFHMFTSVPLAHLAFLVPKSRVEGGDDSASTGAFVILLFVAVQNSKDTFYMHSYLLAFQRQLMRSSESGGKDTPDVLYWCGGAACTCGGRPKGSVRRKTKRENKRTRVLWTRTYNVCDTPEDIVPSQPEVFSKVGGLERSVLLSQKNARVEHCRCWERESISTLVICWRGRCGGDVVGGVGVAKDAPGNIYLMKRQGEHDSV
eukprot:jgi/Bigna1/81421/fgenesh1_pg.80_\